jgi:stage V sporulation protein S
MTNYQEDGHDGFVSVPEQDVHQPIEILRVSSTSRPVSVAGAIAGVMRQYDRVEIQAIGAGAVNQALKAIIIARSYLQENGIDICLVPSFTDLEIKGEARTAMRFLILDRPQ